MRHPLTLLTKEVRPLEIRRDNTALLLQDVHAPFADSEDGYLARRDHEKVLLREFDEYFDTLHVIAPNFGRLLMEARGQGIAIYFSSLGFGPEEEPSAFHQATGWRWNLSARDGGYPGEWAPDIERGEVVYSKPGWSATGNPAFVRRLQDQRATNVILTGTMLEFGILSTVFDLQDRGFGVLIASDGVVPLTETGGQQALGSIAHGMIKLRSTFEILDLLSRLDADGTVLV